MEEYSYILAKLIERAGLAQTVRDHLDAMLAETRHALEAPGVVVVAPTGERRFPAPGEYYRIVGGYALFCNDDIDIDWNLPSDRYEILSVRKP